jgi:hypothetical protein
MAVWQHYPLLEEVAFTRRRISATVPLRVVRRGRREGRRNRNEHRCGRCGKKHLFHDSLLRELYFDQGCRGFSAPGALVVIAQIRANTCALNHSEKRGMVFRAEQPGSANSRCNSGGGRALRSKFQISAPCAGEDPAASILGATTPLPCPAALMIHRVPTLSILNPLAQGSFVLGFFETRSEIIATANSAAVLETSAGGIIGGGRAAVPGPIVGAGLPV